ETLILDAFVDGGADYLWQDGSDGTTFIVSSPGQYSVEVIGACNTVMDLIQVDYEEEPNWPQVVADTVICPGDSVVLDLGTAGVLSYAWDDGSTSPNYVIDAPGIYSVTMEWACGEYRVTIQVRWAEGLGVLDLGPDTLLCPTEVLELNAFVPGYTEYTWQDGATDLIYEVTLPGQYQVVVSDGCVILRDSIEVGWQSCCAVFVPNAFSPNDDGVNDKFRPYFECALSQYELLIFDRWGALLYRGTDPENGWDGRHNGERMGTGVYTWMMTYRELGQDSQLEAGDLLLMR
ncbi:MAG: gliding motility-associated C-terminal domain-containing protein, partial [Phaeodactylibacter sp.]|nr:gliding motility-associated C-terminal domain-containing protein [Phaeodactylibacter sp.]